MTPKRITVHCSATRGSQNLVAEDIRQMHLKRGWNDIGYHFVIRRDGSVEMGRPAYVQGAHVGGHNKDNLGICLIGGLNENGEPEFNYSDLQMHALYALIMELLALYQINPINVCGHRDYSLDLNNDGVITPDEFIKMCPCFDVREWFEQKLDENEVPYVLV